MPKSILTVVLSFLLLSTYSQKTIEMDFKSHFEKYGVDGTFILLKEHENELIVYNQSLVDSGYLPASTFKIPHSLIALEEKVIAGTNDIIEWNGHKWPVDKWNQDQTLGSSIKYSCIWVYFGFAEQIGIEKYKKYVGKYEYGNQKLIGPPTRFWLAGELRISAREQIDFLQRFYNYELPASKESIDKIKDLIVLEKTDTYVFCGKTGGVDINDQDHIMWLVGYVVRNDKPYFYAMNFVTTDFEKTRRGRHEIARNILKELNLIN